MHPKDFIEEFNKTNPAPKTRRFQTREPRGKTTENLEHGAFIFNAFDHLEKLDSPTTQAFVEAQNKRTDNFVKLYDGDIAKEAGKYVIPASGEETYTTKPTLISGRFYNSIRNTKTGHTQHLVRDKAEDAPRVYLDSAEYSADNSSRFNKIAISPDGQKIAFTVESEGSSKHALHVLEFQKDGSLKRTFDGECHWNNEVTWDDDSKGFSYNRWAKEDGRSRLMHHTLGKKQSDDKDLFVTEKYSTHTERKWVLDETGKPSPNSYINVSSNYESVNELYMRPSASEGSTKDAQAKSLKLFDLVKAEKTPPQNRGYVKLGGDEESFFRPLRENDGKLLVRTNKNAPRGKIVEVDMKPPYGQRDFIPQHPTDKLQSVVFGKGHMLVNYGHDAASRLAVHDMQGKHLHDADLPLQSNVEGFIMRGEPGKYGIVTSSFQWQQRTLEYDAIKNEVKAGEIEPSVYNLPDAIVERAFATSKDGTRVPMTIIRGKDTKLDGTAATKLSGYGGFNISQEPHVSASINDWVSKGGIYVQTNLRGGGEFGKDWYDQGRLHNKQNVFDDFAACAEYLASEKYTSPERLAISGGSNGGLLTLATALQRPELFGAVISNVPVTDMLTDRWPDDYGKAKEKRGDFENNMRYSPLHTIKEDVKYPPMYVMTGGKDPTVPASHAYKFVATMQAKSPDTLCLLRVDKHGGHNSLSPEKSTKGLLEQHAFLEIALGPIDQKRYKDQLVQKPKGRHASEEQQTWQKRVLSEKHGRHALQTDTVGASR